MKQSGVPGLISCKYVQFGKVKLDVSYKKLIKNLVKIYHDTILNIRVTKEETLKNL